VMVQVPDVRVAIQLELDLRDRVSA
jgi:hypothetical protein